MLEVEREYYRLHKAEWKTSHFGRFVLVKGSELIGVYNSQDEALAEATRRFGIQPVLIRQVSDVEESEIQIPALTLGLLRANFSSPSSGEVT